MINYFISDAKIYKIENPNKIIEAEKINLKIKENSKKNLIFLMITLTNFLTIYYRN